MYRVKAVEQTLAILGHVAERTELSLPEIASLIGTQTPNAHKLVVHLQDVGLLEASPHSKRYRLGARRLGELSARALETLNPWDEFRQVVPRLREATRMPGLIAVLSGGRAVYVEQFRGPARALGRAFPAHATALGKALLAFLPSRAREATLRELVLDAWAPATIVDPDALRSELARIAERGWALEDGELDAARRSLAAPVRDHTGATIAAIGVGGPAVSMPDDDVERLAALVRSEADRVSAGLGEGAYLGASPRALTVEVLAAVEPPVPPTERDRGGEGEPAATRPRRAKRGSGKGEA